MHIPFHQVTALSWTTYPVENGRFLHKVDRVYAAFCAPWQLTTRDVTGRQGRKPLIQFPNRRWWWVRLLVGDVNNAAALSSRFMTSYNRIQTFTADSCWPRTCQNPLDAGRARAASDRCALSSRTAASKLGLYHATHCACIEISRNAFLFSWAAGYSCGFNRLNLLRVSMTTVQPLPYSWLVGHL